MADFKNTIVNPPLTIKSNKVTFKNMEGTFVGYTQSIFNNLRTNENSIFSFGKNTEYINLFAASYFAAAGSDNSFYIFSGHVDGPRLNLHRGGVYGVGINFGSIGVLSNTTFHSTLKVIGTSTNADGITFVGENRINSSTASDVFSFSNSDIVFNGSAINIKRDLTIQHNTTQGLEIFFPKDSTSSITKFNRYGVVILGENDIYNTTSYGQRPWAGLILPGANNADRGLFVYNNKVAAERDVWQIMIAPASGTNYITGALLFRRSYNLNALVPKAYINPDFFTLAPPFGSMNFTGQHRLSTKDLIQNNIGYIVVSSGEYKNLDNNADITINESLPLVKLSSVRNQKNCIGVISDSEDSDSEDRHYVIGVFGSIYKKELGESRLYVNSLGEGAIWVCNINGNLENGDYITTCEVPGLGMKQELSTKTNYTVAKITCDCDFDLQSAIYKCEEFEWQGQTYRKAFVGCTYHCG